MPTAQKYRLPDSLTLKQGRERLPEKIRGALAQPFIIEEEPFLLSSSIGVAIYPDHGRDATTLARHADEAMYGAKQGGRNGVKLFYAEI